jgi:hypothetical protein
MSKRILIMIVLFLSGWLPVLAQSLPIDNETKKITFQETVPLDSVSREEIYNRTKEWMANFYKTNKYTLDDKANFKVGQDGSFEIQLTYDFKYKSQNNVNYTILIAQKEGKYRYTITDFKFYNLKLGAKTAQSLEVTVSKMSGQNKGEVVTQVNKEVSDVITNLKKFMVTGKPENKEDW